MCTGTTRVKRNELYGFLVLYTDTTARGADTLVHYRTVSYNKPQWL